MIVKMNDTFLKTAISSGEYANVNTIVHGGKGCGKMTIQTRLIVWAIAKEARVGTKSNDLYIRITEKEIKFQFMKPRIPHYTKIK